MTIAINNLLSKIVLTFLLTGLPLFLSAQNGQYLGTEKAVNTSFLNAKAKSAGFGNQIAAKIYEDVKNSYYAVSAKKIASDYVKIRLLEMVYKNNVLTSISGDIKSDYLFFLVNKSLNKSNTDIVSLFEQYKEKAEKEEQSMTPEALKSWLDKHDKYGKKH